jgi:hypothetical protein
MLPRGLRPWLQTFAPGGACRAMRQVACQAEAFSNQRQEAVRPLDCSTIGREEAVSVQQSAINGRQEAVRLLDCLAVG